jgi:hypothetical protein
MGKVLVFTPQSDDASQNFSDYIESAKALPFIRVATFSWDDQQWRLDGLAKPERPTQFPNVNFSSIPGLFGEFARALVAHRIGESLGAVKQIGRYAKPIARLRDLAAVATDFEIHHPSDLSLDVFDETKVLLANKSKSQYSLAQQVRDLKWVHDALDDAALLNVPFDWHPGITTSTSRRNRINPDKSGRPLTDRELEAIAYAWRNAETPRDVVVTSILALMCCAPMRIEEVLSLPVDCEVLPDPGDGFRGGLRWRPKKGGRPQIKFVPEAMIPIAHEALIRIRDVTEPARMAARQRLNGDKTIDVPDDFPVYDTETGLTYDEALCVSLRGLATENHRVNNDKVERLTYAQIRRAMLGDMGATSIFHSTGALAEHEPAFELTTHMARHHLNNIAQKVNVPQADIALWSGRKLVTQNNVYDHETAEELVARIKAKRGPEKLPMIKIDNRAAWEMSIVKETAHTTEFGWCQQSLRQDPCQMFGQCLNCQHLVCIKGAEGKLANIKCELEREKKLQAAALGKKEQGYPVKDRWLDLFAKKIARLEDLIAILESPDVENGAAIQNGHAGPELLPQFDMTAFGKSRHTTSISPSKRAVE